VGGRLRAWTFDSRGGSAADRGFNRFQLRQGRQSIGPTGAFGEFVLGAVLSNLVWPSIQSHESALTCLTVLKLDEKHYSSHVLTLQYLRSGLLTF
jgi:hypothetical protein